MWVLGGGLELCPDVCMLTKSQGTRGTSPVALLIRNQGRGGDVPLEGRLRPGANTFQVTPIS